MSGSIIADALHLLYDVTQRSHSLSEGQISESEEQLTRLKIRLQNEYETDSEIKSLVEEIGRLLKSFRNVNN